MDKIYHNWPTNDPAGNAAAAAFEKEYPKPILPGPKPRHMVQVSSLLKKPFLESPEEVEEFLTKLRSELTNTLARGERIQIK
jgi:hypothetical protein